MKSIINVFCLVLLTSSLAAIAHAESETGILDCEKAEFAYQAEKYNESLIYLKRCRQALPNFLPAITLLGKLQNYYERYDLAVISFSDAVEKGADPELFAKEWSESLLASRHFDRLVEFNGYTGFAIPIRIEWLTARAQACSELNSDDCAKESYLQLEALTDGVVAPLGLAGLAMKSQAWREAERQLSIASSRSEKDIRILLAYSHLALLQNKKQQAMAYLEQAELMSTDDLRVLKMRVDILLSGEQPEQALTSLDLILKKSPEDPMAMIVRNSLKPEERYEEILLKLKARIEQLSKEYKSENKDLYYLQGLIAFQEGNYEQALQSFQPLYADKTRYPHAFALLARAYVALGLSAPAIEILEKQGEQLLEQSPALISLLIELYIEEGKVFKAVSSWQAFNQQYPERIDAKLLEAKILFARKLVDDGLSKLEALSVNYPDNEDVLRFYAMTLTQVGEFDEAMAIIESRLTTASQKASWFNFKGAVHLKMNDKVRAKEAFQNALAEDHNLLAAKLNLAWLQFSTQDNPLSVLSEVQALRTKNPHQRQVRHMYASMLLAAGQYDQALSEYESLYHLDDINQSVIDALLAIYLQQKKFDLVEDMLTRLIELGYDVARNQIRLTHVYIETGQVSRASSELYKVMLSGNGQYDVMMSVAKLSLAIGKNRLAERALLSALNLQTTDALAIIKLVELYLDLNQTDQAQTFMEQSADEFSDMPEIWLLRGRIAEQRNKPVLASEHYQHALELDPSFELAYAKLYSLTLYGIGEKVFEKALTQQVEKQPENAFLQSLLGQYYYYNGRFEEAVSAYEYLFRQTVNEKQKGAYARRLAQVYFHFNIENAQKYLDFAEENTPDDPYILALKGWNMVMRGMAENGLELLREAQALNGKNPDIQYFIAYTLVELGLRKEAAEIIEGMKNSNNQTTYKEGLLSLEATLANSNS